MRLRHRHHCGRDHDRGDGRRRAGDAARGQWLPSALGSVLKGCLVSGSSEMSVAANVFNNTCNLLLLLLAVMLLAVGHGKCVQLRHEELRNSPRLLLGLERGELELLEGPGLRVRHIHCLADARNLFHNRVGVTTDHAGAWRVSPCCDVFKSNKIN